ncbi:MAG: zinc-ribbon domain-containing protein [Chloroflexota bacterium]|nr:zinc-ribbon domain-containing protein [Chloroflexota bacterium]
MFCDKCGAENPDDGSFCQKCGSSLSAPAPVQKSSVSQTEPVGATMIKSPKAQGDGLNIPQMLFYGAILALAVGVLAAILSAVGLRGATGAFKASQFFAVLLDGILVAGVLAGFYALISTRKDG